MARCYRYERPQEGRYREFTQLGVEFLNPKSGTEKACEQVRQDCEKALRALGIPDSELSWNLLAKRGLGYYLGGSGLEASCSSLGAQSQVAGGGAYAEGAGFAIGSERAVLAMSKANTIAS